MRRSYQLNINLNVIGEANTLAAATDRGFRALEVLRQFDPELKADRRITENEDDGPEITLDDTLVVQLATETPNGFHVALRALAEELGQQAIAVWEGYRPGYPTGYLVGPNVHAWGRFDINRFKFMDPHALA
jgi:hypothetical protein